MPQPTRLAPSSVGSRKRVLDPRTDDGLARLLREAVVTIEHKLLQCNVHHLCRPRAACNLLLHGCDQVERHFHRWRRAAARPSAALRTAI